MMRRFLEFILVLAILFGGVMIVETLTQPLKVGASNIDYSHEQMEALNYINKIRREIGSQDLKFQTELNTSVSNHADYLNLNGYFPDEPLYSVNDYEDEEKKALLV